MNTEPIQTLEHHLSELIKDHTLQAVLGQLSYAVIEIARSNPEKESNLRFVAQQIYNLKEWAK